MMRGLEINSFSVYPNPMLGEVYIDLNDNDSTVSYVILNKHGNIIRESNNLMIRNTISLKALPLGMYTVKVKSGNKVMIKKFLKL